VDAARIKEDALGQGGLAGVNVGHDPDIPVSNERSLPSHRRLDPFSSDRDSTTCLSVLESAVMETRTIRER
jgi:hypothetical protein